MPDRALREMLTLKDAAQYITSLNEKITDLVNDEYWPAYMFRARLIPLSKNGMSYTSLQNVRTLSVLPVIAKVIERLLLNKIIN